MTWPGTDAPFWCCSCSEHRVRSANTECPICDTTPPRPIPRPRMDHDPRPAPVTTTSGEVEA